VERVTLKPGGRVAATMTKTIKAMTRSARIGISMMVVSE
jgi:hypothetical protein